MNYITFKSPEIESLDKSKLLVLIPIGSIEAHGPHLPIGTDSMIVEHFANKVEEKFPDKVVLTPAIKYTFNSINCDYPGTLSITPENFAHYLENIVFSFFHHGFENFLIFSSHGANEIPVKLAIQNILHHSVLEYRNNPVISTESPKAKSGEIFNYDLSRKDFSTRPENQGSLEMTQCRDDAKKYPRIAFKTWWQLAKLRSRHAEKLETELMMVINPDLVDMSKAIDCKPENPWHYFPSRKVFYPDTYGVNGEPTRANVESAKVVYGKVLGGINYYIEDILRKK